MLRTTAEERRLNQLSAAKNGRSFAEARAVAPMSRYVIV